MYIGAHGIINGYRNMDHQIGLCLKGMAFVYQL